ncbi:MAG: hypothetical protein AB7O47_11270 [Flavobacteriales bacterium]
MKNLFTFISLIGFSYSISAQNSLQDSFNKALEKKEVQNTLDNFEAYFDGNQRVVQLNWSKLKGQKVDVFTIEKSNDKTNWQVLAQINGVKHCDEAVDYFQTDNQPVEGISYYRLKQNDAEGNELFSNTVPVKTVFNEKKANLFPADDNTKQVINISFENVKEEQLLVVLRDIKGTEYYSKVLVNLEDDAMVAIPVDASIPKGDYLIIASSENQMYSQNVRIQ